MTYDASDPEQNAYWDEVFAKQLEDVARELYGQAH